MHGAENPIQIIGEALWMAVAMGWQILWPLVLGFTLSGVVQAVVSKKEMSRLLPDASPRSLSIACALGAASSSCSYAAVALARALFRKQASFTAAMAFELASTNLVLELGIVLVVLMGWPFMLAEAIGAVLMVAIIAVLFRLLLSEKLVAQARAQADKGVAGRMEGHAEMDMAVTGGPLWKRVFSEKGRTATSHYFVMDWASVWLDIVVGLVLSGAVAVLVPSEIWSILFLRDHPVAARFVGPLVGPLVSVVSFVCSVGNIPLAAVLWNKGMSFGGVIAFIFADLIVLPILNIYRKYYGWRMSAFLFVTFYVAMASAGLVVDLLLEALHLVPSARNAVVATEAMRWNYTTFLNIGFGILAALLVARFLRTGGPRMLRHMNPKPSAAHAHGSHEAARAVRRMQGLPRGAATAALSGSDRRSRTK
jgi:uncharacterized membrane protein YraQ (UPF0718 family)